MYIYIHTHVYCIFIPYNWGPYYNGSNMFQPLTELNHKWCPSQDYLPTTPSSLYSDFGSHRSTEQLTLPELALQLLGRNLYQLAELPKPPGVALTIWKCVWKCCVLLLTQWFCWSLSLRKMAISLGIYPIFRQTHMDPGNGSLGKLRG